ncbi:hypothetical protein GCM10017083_49150 [Thalassobaculum fulvum]|uniref:Uncharacterized protein n=1 Tax=Thalassobaculum fulvum TaxID=1633335 RepID=A0A918XWI0_9PROT|nr:hypothetical protein [Thalassobaculum fulvum]GHD61596.1 hypothetical protein GCM10017083_49150 [Thalassobaculum fulvum]
MLRPLLHLARLLAFLTALAGPAHAAATQAAIPAAPGPREVTVGVYVSSLHGLDFARETFRTTFWLWASHDDPEFRPAAALEIVNAQTIQVEKEYREALPNGRFTDMIKVQAVLNQRWDVQDYPFDDQRPSIVVESVGSDATRLRLVPDARNSVIEPSLHVTGWTTGALALETADFLYRTNFGIEGAGYTAYSRLTASVAIERDGLRIFFTAFVGFFVAAALMLLVAATGAVETIRQAVGLRARLGLATAAIFAAVGNKYVLDASLPFGGSFSLADVIELATFAMIAFVLLVAVVAEWADARHRPDVATRVSWIGLVAFVAVQFALTGWYVVDAAA